MRICAVCVCVEREGGRGRVNSFVSGGVERETATFRKQEQRGEEEEQEEEEEEETENDGRKRGEKEGRQGGGEEGGLRGRV